MDYECKECEYYDAEEERCTAFQCNGFDCGILPCEEEDIEPAWWKDV